MSVWEHAEACPATAVGVGLLHATSVIEC